MHSRRLVSCITIGHNNQYRNLTFLKHTPPWWKNSFRSLESVFAQVTTLLGSAVLQQVFLGYSANPDSVGDGRPSLSRGRSSKRCPSPSSTKRQNTFDLLFDPSEVLDIRPMRVDADGIGEVGPYLEDSKHGADVEYMIAHPQSSKSARPPPYSLIDDFPLPAYTP
jgi:hypothetical protein